MLHTFRAFPAFLALMLAGCADDAGPPSGPLPDGTVRVAIQVTAGGIPDTNGYTLDVAGAHADAPSSGGIFVLPGVPSGPQAVSLGSLDPWCQGPVTRPVTVVPEDTVDAIFSISCGEVPWPLTIITQTVGIDGGGGYFLNITGLANRPVQNNDTVAVLLPIGQDPEIRLTQVPARCWPVDSFPLRHQRGVEPTTITLRVACGVIATMLRDSMGASKFVLLNLGDGRVRPLPMVTYSPRRVEWQPYGRRLVLQGPGHSLDVLDLGTGILTRRINGDVSLGDTDTLAYGASWYNPGNDLLVSASRPAEPTRLWKLNDNTTALRLPADGIALLPEEYALSRHSGNGHVAVTAKVNGESVLRIKTSDSTYTVLNEINLYEAPAWGGLGVYAVRLTQVSWGYTNAIWRVGTNGANAVQLTTPATGEYDSDPFLSYFGDMLYFTRHPTDAGSPYLMQMRVSTNPVAPTPVVVPSGTPFGPASSGN